MATKRLICDSLDLTHARTELLDGGCAFVCPNLSQGRCGEIKKPLPRIALALRCLHRRR